MTQNVMKHQTGFLQPKNLTPDQFTAAVVFKLDFPFAHEAEQLQTGCTKTDLSPDTPGGDRLTHTHIESPESRSIETANCLFHTSTIF